MKNNMIEISGITSEDELKNNNIQYPCKEICKSYNITIDENNTNIEQILQVSFNTKVTQWKYIFTHGNCKIFIEGILNIKVLFIDDVYSKNIYSTEVKKVISEVLPVENTFIENIKPKIFIEEAFVNHLSKKRFSLSALILICTTLDAKNENVNFSSSNKDTNNEDINFNTSNKNTKITKVDEDIEERIEKSEEKHMDKPNEIITDKSMDKSQEISMEKNIEKSKKKPININIEYDMNLKEQNIE